MSTLQSGVHHLDEDDALAGRSRHCPQESVFANRFFFYFLAFKKASCSIFALSVGWLASPFIFSSSKQFFLQMIIQMAAFCKWSTGCSCLLQMIISVYQPHTNDHLSGGLLQIIRIQTRDLHCLLGLVSSIKHDLTISCFQLGPITGDEGDKISKK